MNFLKDDSNIPRSPIMPKDPGIPETWSCDRITAAIEQTRAKLELCPSGAGQLRTFYEADLEQLWDMLELAAQYGSTVVRDGRLK